MTTVPEWFRRTWWPSVKCDANRIKITLRRGRRRITATLELADAEEFWQELTSCLDKAFELHGVMYSTDEESDR